MSVTNRQIHQSLRTDWLGRLNYSLRLVPEGPLLLVCLILAEVSNFPAFFSIIGLLIAFWFITRMALIFGARQALATADRERAAWLIGIAYNMHPWSADILTLQGTVHLLFQRTNEAVTTFTKAVNLLPTQPMLAVALATAQLEADDPVASRGSAERALALDPRCLPAYLTAAAAERALGADPAVIEELLRAGLRQAQSPADEAQVRCELAEHLIAVERNSEARLALQHAEALLPRCSTPQQAGLHYRIGEMLHRMGELEPARRHFSASEQIDPSGPYAADAWRAARS